jgi:NAD(P)H-dependent flavin oxidoreductase YrpB (nitropropane dioxygenase family)
VAAAVSKAGGLGVLGCVRFTEADDLETFLQWMDENTDGRPYGVDVVMPAKVPTEGTAVDIDKLVPQGTSGLRQQDAGRPRCAAAAR